MNYEKQERETKVEVNLFTFINFVLKKLWILILVTVAFALAGLFISSVVKDDIYTSKISFVVNTLSANDKVENSDISASINVATTYQYILKSRPVVEEVVNKSAIPVQYNEVRGSMSVAIVTGSNVIEMSIKTTDPEKSYSIAKALVENYEGIVTKIYSNASLNICDYPVKATRPDVDSSSYIVALFSAALGALICLILFFIYFVIRDTVRTVADIDSKLGINVLGTLRKSNDRRSKNTRPLITNKRNNFAFVETFKAIRTKIESDSVHNNHKVYIVTSACESEGKTTVSTNLAITLAQNGRSVLLIDADLRKPTVSKVLGIEGSGKGLADIISGKIPLDNAIRYVERHNIFVISDVHSTANPSEILSNKNMENLLNALKSEFDFIIIDTSPASVVTDAAIISSVADAAVLVISEDVAPLSRIKMSINDIESNGAEVIGCVFNNASVSGSHYGRRYGKGYYGSYGYGSYGSYGYGSYGYGYGEDKKSDSK